MSEWIEWKGGECPVRDGFVDAMRRDLDILSAYAANILRWFHVGDQSDIIAYRRAAPLLQPAAPDPVSHPPHYTSHPSGIQPITITEHMGFCLGNAIKYIWRADLKGGEAQGLEDLRKAVWYLEREIAKRARGAE